MNKTMEKLEVRQTIKPGIESYIYVNQIARIFLPQVTLDVLAAQQNSAIMENSGGEEVFQVPQTSAGGKIATGLGAPYSQYYSKLENCTFYPFSLILDKGASIEFVAPNHRIFTDAIQAFKIVIHHKKTLKKLAKFE